MNLIIMVLPAWLLALLPNLIGGLINAGTSSSSINQMNKYNDPRAQLQRLNAAGLPFAAFSQGQAGNQSSLPDLSGIGDGISSYMTNRVQQQQMKLLNEQIDKAKAEADTAFYHSQIAKDEADAALNSGSVIDGISRSNAYIHKLREYEMHGMSQFIQQHEYDMKKIDLAIKSSDYESGRTKQRTEAEIDNLLAKNKLAQQVWTTQDDQHKARHKIIATMEKNGLTFMEAMLLQILEGLGGGMKIGAGHIGF